MKLTSKGIPYIVLETSLQQLILPDADWDNLPWLSTVASSNSKSNIFFRLKTLNFWTEFLEHHVCERLSSNKMLIPYDPTRSCLVAQMEENEVRLRNHRRKLSYSDGFSRALTLLQLIGIKATGTCVFSIDGIKHVELVVPTNLQRIESLLLISELAEYRKLLLSCPDFKTLKAPDCAKRARLRIKEAQTSPAPEPQFHEILEWSDLFAESIVEEDHQTTSPGVTLDIAQVDLQLRPIHPGFGALPPNDRFALIQDIVMRVCPSCLFV